MIHTVLPLSRPQKHPETGIYWFRMRVRADLVGTVGRKEVNRNLATKDPSEAKRRFAEVRGRYEDQWVNLRDPSRALTEREAHELAAPIHDTWLAQHCDFPNRQTFWDTKVGATLWSRRDEDAPPLPANLGFDPGPAYESAFRFAGHARLEDWCLERAAEFLAQKGLPPSPSNEATMARAIGAAIERASLALERGPQGIPGGVSVSFSAQPSDRQTRSTLRPGNSNPPGSSRCPLSPNENTSTA